MSYCEQCGAALGGANFCPSCGAQVAPLEAENPYAVGSQTQAVGPVVADADAPELPGFFRAYGMFWEKFASMKGRASRREFWFVVMWQPIIAIVLTFTVCAFFLAVLGSVSVHAEDETIAVEEASDVESQYLDDDDNYGPFAGLELIPIILAGIPYVLINFIPFLCLVVRRLHDANVPGWAALALFIPFLGKLRLALLLVVGLLPPTQGANNYGPAPAKRINA